MDQDKRQFEQFYSENIDRIYRFVLFRVGCQKEIAEDLTAEIFMKALNAYERFDETISRSAWIYTIARNHLSNYYRDKKQTVDIEDVALTLVGDDGRVDMERAEGQILLEKTLNKLSKDERQLVTLKHLDGYSFKQMSELLGRSPGALKVSTHRAMKKLKTLCGSNTN